MNIDFDDGDGLDCCRGILVVLGCYAAIGVAAVVAVLCVYRGL